jgi:hypothetical protein
MSRRRRNGSESSLELLLDTICNTFGGVLFLAMLISLLLAQSRRRTEADETAADPRAALTPAELTRLVMSADQLAAEVARLEQAIVQARAAAVDFSVPELETQLLRLEAAEQEMHKAEADRRRLLSEVAAAQAAAARALGKVVADERGTEQAEAAAAAARKRLDAVTEDRSSLVQSAIALQETQAARATLQTTGRAPRERATTKKEFGVMLRFGRMYLMKVPRGDDLVVNDADFFVESGGVRNVAHPKPHAGLELGDPSGLGAALDKLLQPFPPAVWYPCLVVHPDTFDVFIALKAELVARGYEYRLMPTAQSVVDRGGQGAVQ